jgi:thiamine biosynthesis lipoprotein
MMSARAVRVTFPAMSTTVEVIGVGIPARELARAADLGRRLAAEWEAQFSRFRPDSDLSRLNAAGGRAVHVHDDVIDLIETARRAVRRTGGLFDPAVLPALEAAGYDRDIERVRSGPLRFPGEPRPTAGPAGWERVQIDRDRGEVRLPAQMRIDLGGVAKGAFVDRLAGQFAGWPGGCIDTGGDLRVWGLPPDGDTWIIGIEHPLQPEQDLAAAHVLAHDGAGVATSGIHRRQWQCGARMLHHLIDPRTGAPLSGDIRSATAFAASVTTAEIATKALMLTWAVRGSQETFGAAMAIVVAADGCIDIIQEGNADARSVTLVDPGRRSA